MESKNKSEDRQELYDATRLMADGKFRCRRCSKISPTVEGIITTFANAVLYAVHPRCMKHERITVEVGDQKILVIAEDRPHSIVLASEIPGNTPIPLQHVQPVDIKL